MALTFGWEPIDFVVSLSRGGDFIFTLESSVAWPVGIEIQLRFSATRPEESVTPIIWPAAISGVFASWDVPATGVAAVLDAQARYVRLRYAEADGSVLMWGKGCVSAH